MSGLTPESPNVEEVEDSVEHSVEDLLEDPVEEEARILLDKIIEETDEEVEDLKKQNEETSDEPLETLFEKVMIEKDYADQDGTEDTAIGLGDQAAGMAFPKTMRKIFLLQKCKGSNKKSDEATQYDERDFMPKQELNINYKLIQQLKAYYDLDIDVRDNYRTICQLDETITDANLLFIGFVEALKSFPETQKDMAKILILEMLQRRKASLME